MCIMQLECFLVSCGGVELSVFIFQFIRPVAPTGVVPVAAAAALSLLYIILNECNILLPHR